VSGNKVNRFDRHRRVERFEKKATQDGILTADFLLIHSDAVGFDTTISLG
jgi:hypothetical protein